MSRFGAMPLDVEENAGDANAGDGLVEGLMLRKEFEDGSFKRMKLVRGEFQQ